MIRERTTCLLLLLVFTGVAAKIPVGINLNGLTYFTPGWAFIDAFKLSMPWLSQNSTAWHDERDLLLDDLGWVKELKPNQYAGTLMFRSLQGADGVTHYPSGVYYVSWEGQGKLAFSFDATVINSSSSQAFINVKPSSNGILLRILATDPSDYIRNIKVIMPGFKDTTQTFHPMYISLLQDRGWSAIRFMDFLATNNSPNKFWSNRTTPAHQTQASERGIALEYIIELCNLLQLDAWVNVPHLATNNYIVQMGQLLSSKIDPAVTVYVEHSNECWNSIFKQATYCREQGLQMNLSTNPYEAQLRYHSQRSVDIFTTWKPLFDSAQRKLIRVLGSQAANPFVSQVVSEWKSAFKYSDAVGIAPYIPPYGKTAQELAQMTVEGICNLMLDGGLMHIKNQTVAQLDFVNSVGLLLVAYEGGSGLAPPFGPYQKVLTEKFEQVSRNACMIEINEKNLQQWNTLMAESDVYLFNVFDLISGYGQYGDWGLLEWMEQDPKTTPKFEGVLEFLK